MLPLFLKMFLYSLSRRQKVEPWSKQPNKQTKEEIQALFLQQHSFTKVIDMILEPNRNDLIDAPLSNKRLLSINPD